MYQKKVEVKKTLGQKTEDYTGSKRTGRINEKRARIKSGEILFNIPCVMRALFYRHVFERSC